MTLETLCIKCKDQAAIHIRRTWYCNKCYLDLLKLKFDAAMGQSVSSRVDAKALLCLEENASSLMLLDLCQKYFKESSLLTFKKRSFQIIDLVAGRITDSPETYKDSIINLSMDDKMFTDNWKSCTSKEDAKQIIKFRMFADLAIEHGCTALLYPDTCTDLAILSISGTALGKGLGLSQTIAPFLQFKHKDQQLLIIRPLFDITDEDVLNYNSIVGLETVKSVENDSKSIQNTTRNFLLQLEKEHPSTINIVAKTCLKLDQKVGDGICTFCQGPRLEYDVVWRQSHTLLKPSHQPLDDGNVTDLSQDPIFSSLCYSCQNIMMDVNNDDGLDVSLFSSRTISSDLKIQIKDYLL